MKVYFHCYNTNFGSDQNRKLIPVSKYKGPVLELTPDEIMQIEMLQKEIKENEIAAYKLESCLLVEKAGNLIRYYREKLGEIDFNTKIIKDKIRQIKIDRFQKQLKKL